MEFTGEILNSIRRRKGLPRKVYEDKYSDARELEFTKLESIIRKHVDIKKIYQILDRDDIRSI